MTSWLLSSLLVFRVSVIRFHFWRPWTCWWDQIWEPTVSESVVERAKYVLERMLWVSVCFVSQNRLVLHVCPESSFQTLKNTTSLIPVILNLRLISRTLISPTEDTLVSFYLLNKYRKTVSYTTGKLGTFGTVYWQFEISLSLMLINQGWTNHYTLAWYTRFSKAMWCEME